MPNRAIFYKRKSSDSEDRQILSLASQDRTIRETTLAFNQYQLIANLEESKSAKAPGRPLFNDMCERLESGKAGFIICWQLNRLARNPVDGGRIIWLVQNYGVKIVTPTKIYDANDLLLMYVEFAMSNQFITDLRKSTMRGIDDKIRSGIAPLRAPIGYINDVMKKQGLRDILPDPDRFDLCRKMWDLMLTGSYTPPKVLEIATKDWGLVQRNGKPLSRSKIYDLFTNVFYIGSFMYAGEVHPGKHKAMVTPEEYDRVQVILGSKGKGRLSSHDFAFNGALVRCPCGSSVTCEERYRKTCPSCKKRYNALTHSSCPACLAEAPQKFWYTALLHCSRKKDATCGQPAISVKDFEKQVASLMATLTMPQDFIEWTFRKLRKTKEEEYQGLKTIHDEAERQLTITIADQESLVANYTSLANRNRDFLSDEDYQTRKEKLRTRRKELEDRLAKFGLMHDNQIDAAEKAFNFARTLRERFEKTKEPTDKRQMLAALGSNLVLDNKILRLDVLKPVEVIQEGATLAKDTLKKFEPNDQVDNTAQREDLYNENPLLGDRRDSNPQHPAPQAGALPLCYDHHYILDFKNLLPNPVLKYISLFIALYLSKPAS